MRRGSPPPIKLYSELSSAALKVKLDKELAVLYALRAINSTGSSDPGQQGSSGWLSLEGAVAALVEHFGYSQRTAYRLLKAGDGKFWDIKGAPPGGEVRRRTTIEFKGLRRVAQYLNTPWLSRPTVVKVEDFRGLKKRRAQLYASFHKPFHKSFLNPFHKPEGAEAKPISRASLAEATGVQRRQQQRYDKEVGTRREPNFLVRVNGEGILVRVRHWVYGKNKRWEKDRRLGNTYYSKAEPAPKGMVKRINDDLKQGSFNSDESPLLQRFFLSARSLLRHPVRHEEALLLVNRRDRVIRGRMEWCEV